MTLQIKDRVAETTTTVGVGAYSLAGTKLGFQSFIASVGNGNTCYYCVTDGTNWEVSLGTVSSGTPQHPLPGYCAFLQQWKCGGVLERRQQGRVPYCGSSFLEQLLASCGGPTGATGPTGPQGTEGGARRCWRDEEPRARPEPQALEPPARPATMVLLARRELLARPERRALEPPAAGAGNDGAVGARRELRARPEPLALEPAARPATMVLLARRRYRTDRADWSDRHRNHWRDWPQRSAGLGWQRRGRWRNRTHWATAWRDGSHGQRARHGASGPAGNDGAVGATGVRDRPGRLERPA